MEFLIRWQCQFCIHSNQTLCHDCNGNGYKERWVPFAQLNDVRALYKIAFVIRDCRKVSECVSIAYLD